MREELVKFVESLTPEQVDKIMENIQLLKSLAVGENDTGQRK